jgi:hypothetical protein
VNHPGAFKPSNPAKKGYNKTLEKFPAYVEDQGRKINLKSVDYYAKQSGLWKPTTDNKTKP